MKPELLAKIEALVSIKDDDLLYQYEEFEIYASSIGNYDDALEMGIAIGHTMAVKKILQIIKEETN